MSKKLERLGEIKTMRCGLKAEIIEYNSVDDVLVRFETGETKRADYRNFKKLRIAPDSLNRLDVQHLVYKNKYIGASQKAYNGLNVSIIDYKSRDEVIVQFEDGVTVVTRLMTWNTGKIGHPSLSAQKSGHFHGFATKPCWKLPGFYKTECFCCGQKNILTPQQMMAGCPNCKGEKNEQR